MTDELALDFDHWQSVLVSNFGPELTSEQIASLAAIDVPFTSFSRGGKEFTEEFWTDQALEQSSGWEVIRDMAGRAFRPLWVASRNCPKLRARVFQGGPSVGSL